jgi:RNA polymerase sigma-70 factor, ECF subfamily
MERVEFEPLAMSQLDAVYRLALRLTRDQNSAEDLVQDTYAKALRPAAIERFDTSKSTTAATGDSESAMRSWLFTICHNVFYSQIKRSSKGPVSVGEFFDEAADERPPDEPPPVWDRAGMDWEQVDERLKSAIDGLKEEYREILLMWGVDGLKYREIAEIMEIPIGTVMSRLHRARKLVSEQLSGQNGFVDEFGLGSSANG